jgi:hypothetical protein
MINEVIRGLFECYINARKEITSLDYVTKVNEGIKNLEGSINMNIWVLNEEMGWDLKIKERL